jgi:hypothetical protein
MKYSFDEKVVEKLMEKIEAKYRENSYDTPEAIRKRAELTVEKILDSYVEQMANILYQVEFLEDT